MSVGSRAAGLAAFLLLGLAVPVIAAPATLPTLEAEIGLGGVVHGEWTLVEVRCRLAADASAFRGAVQITTDETQIAGCETSLQLAPGAERRLRFSVPVLRGREYRLRLLDEAGSVLSESTPTDDAERVDGALRLLLAESGLSALDERDRKGAVRLARVKPTALPRDVRCLVPLQAIFLPLDASTEELVRDARVVEILRTYVERGGRLVLIGRPATPRTWVGTPLEALCPVRDPTPGSLVAGEVAGLLGALDAPALPVVRARLAPGSRWLSHSGSLGLVAERRTGEGEVLFLTFDPDGRVARSSDRLAQALSGLATARSRPRGYEDDWGVRELAKTTFAARTVLSPLGFGLLVGILLAHALIVGPLTLTLSRRRRRPWLSLLVPPLLSGLLGLFVLLAVVVARTDETAARAVVVATQAGPGRSARAQVELGLFAESPCRLELDLGPGSWTPRQRERGALAALQFREPPPWLRQEGGVARRIAPIPVAAHGLSRWRLTGWLPPLPLRHEVDAEGRFLIAAEEQTEGLFALRCGKEPRLQALPPVSPGAPLTWDPNTAPAFDEVGPILEEPGDPFEEAPPRRALVHRVAAALQRAWAQRASQGDGLPAGWVLRVSRAQVPSLSVLHGEEECAVEGLILQLCPLEANE